MAVLVTPGTLGRAGLVRVAIFGLDVAGARVLPGAGVAPAGSAVAELPGRLLWAIAGLARGSTEPQATIIPSRASMSPWCGSIGVDHRRRVVRPNRIGGKTLRASRP